MRLRPISLSVVLLAACAHAPPHALQAGDVPQTWAASSVMVSEGAAWPTRDWWNGFGSPELTGLLYDAEANGFDVQTAAQRVIEAEAGVTSAGSTLWPSLSASAGASRRGVYQSGSADSLSYSAFSAELTTSNTLVDSGAGSRPLAVVVESRGEAGILKLYDTSTTASLTTSGPLLTLHTAVPFATSTGEITAVSWHGAGWVNSWLAGIVIAANTPAGTAKVATPPRVHILFRNV